jgi:bifunctional oligoribonuclease and PAP phosphatase NrnA
LHTKKKHSILNSIIKIKPQLLAKPSPNIVITTHHKPDADALGSSLGLYHFLKRLGISSTVVTPTDYGDFLTWLPGEEHIINYEADENKGLALVAQADFIFCLDFNALKRINKLGEYVAAASGIKVMIDHHLEPENFSQFALWTTQVSSTSELVFRLIELWDETDKIDAEIASCLYAGIMTDTGGFRHDTTFPSTHRAVATLIEKGAKPAKIVEAIHDNYSESRMRFIGFCLSEKLQILPEYHTALICVTADELKRFNVITGDSEGLVNFGLSIKGIKLSVLIVDRTILRKMSFRAKGNFPANELAKTYFNGGGHFSAAGGESNEPIEAVELQFKTVLQQYHQLLNEPF